MRFFRFTVIALPQVLILLLVGGRYDLLGGWNHTDAALFTLMSLFLLNPLLTLSLLVVETRQYFKARKTAPGRTLLRKPVLAIVLFIEALATDLFILTQLKM